LFVSAIPEEPIPVSNQTDSRERRQEEAIKTVSRQLGAVTSERDEYKKEIAQLREKITQLESLRQRKTVVSESGVAAATTKQMEVFEQQNNIRLIQLLIVAIVFFLLGRYSI
jgi:flagellar motility protein MotE (MotC chaperone)